MIYHHCYGKSYNRKNDENLPKFRNVLWSEFRRCNVTGFNYVVITTNKDAEKIS